MCFQLPNLLVRDASLESEAQRLECGELILLGKEVVKTNVVIVI